MNRYICIHGHFYQPPRENPWLEEVELQDSAHPYHDWNDRITAECYGPNSASRILDADKMVVDIVNNYSRISFNIGPTLLSWMERRARDPYRAILWADAEGQRRFSGHGPALAQVYNHMIMPLANIRDKRTQVVWGVADFKHRFGRFPEGMWLPETAVDLETLGVLAENGVAFAILAPHQARRTRRMDGRRWREVTGGRIDPKTPYTCHLPSGKAITLFFYDGPIARHVAFAGLLSSGEAFANRLADAFDDGDGEADSQIVNIATDGETYGHHHRFGDMALAYCLRHIDSNNLAAITVYGEFLEKHPPTHEVEIIENSSWSCVHGIERWRSDCGCNSGSPGWRQQWRAPLREALDWLRDSLAPVYERELGKYFGDPWKARDEYIEVVLDREPDRVDGFLSRQAARQLSRDEVVTVLRLLEMQRHSMLMYTSCGWFFDEISGIEATQVLQYAARAIQLARSAGGVELEPDFLGLLEKAPSNIPEHENGARIYNKLVKPAMVDLMRVAAHYAVLSLFKDYDEVTQVNCYTAHREEYMQRKAGEQKLAVGRARFRSNITRDARVITFAVLHLGDHNLMGGVREFGGGDAFLRMQQEIEEAFAKSEIAGTIRTIDTHFETHNYSLWHLFRDEQRIVFNRILESRMRDLEASFKRVYEHNYPIMLILRDLSIPLPKPFALSAEMTIAASLRRLLEAEKPDLMRLEQLVEEIARWKVETDWNSLSFAATSKLEGLLEALGNTPEDVALLETTEGLVRILRPSPLDLALTKAQPLYLSIARRFLPQVKEKAVSGDGDAGRWVEHFETLGRHLGVRTG